MNTSAELTVYLSYFEETSDWARDVGQRLQANRVRVLTGRPDKAGGVPSRSEILQQIEASQHFILLMGSEPTDEILDLEWFALTEHCSGLDSLKDFIIPVTINDALVPGWRITEKYSLDSLPPLPLYGPGSQHDEGIARLLEAIGVKRQGPRPSGYLLRELLDRPVEDIYGTPSRWFWEVLIDVISVALDIPIQIFYPEPAQRLYQAGQLDRFFKGADSFVEKLGVFQGNPVHEIEFLEAHRGLTEAILEGENAASLTRPSHAYSLLASFRRRSDTWRARDILWSIAAADNAENRGFETYLQAEKPLLEAMAIRLESLDKTLLVGPVWSEPGRGSDEAFQKQRVDEAIRLVNDSLLEVNRRPILDRFRLSAAGAKRRSFIEDDLRKRGEDVALVVNLIAEIAVEARLHPLRRCDLVHIAEWLCVMKILDAQWASLSNRDDSTRPASFIFEGATSHYSLSRSIKLHNVPGREELWLVSSWPGEALGESTRIRLAERPDPNFQRGMLVKKRLRIGPGDYTEDLRNELALKVERRLVSIHNRRSGHKGEDLGLLADILSNEFGSFFRFFRRPDDPGLRADEASLAPVLTEVADTICRYSRRRLLADVCAMYYYDYPDRLLQLRGASLACMVEECEVARAEADYGCDFRYRRVTAKHDQFLSSCESEVSQELHEGSFLQPLRFRWSCRGLIADDRAKASTLNSASSILASVAVWGSYVNGRESRLHLDCAPSRAPIDLLRPSSDVDSGGLIEHGLTMKVDETKCPETRRQSLCGLEALVTGAAGFLGGHLVRALAQRGAKVHACRRPGSGVQSSSQSPGIYWHELDLRDGTAVERLWKRLRPPVLIHAAVYGVHPGRRDRHGMVETNVLGTFHLLESARRFGIERLLLVGGSSEYGRKARSMKETDIVEPRTLYGATKAAATMLCQQATREWGLPALILRPFSIYGPHEPSHRLIPTAIRAALEGQVLRLTEPGWRRDFVFVDDVVEAFVNGLSLEASIFKELSGSIFNIGSGQQHTNEEVVSVIDRLTEGGLEIEVGAYPAHASDSRHWVADIAAAEKALGWQPVTPLAEGLRKTLAAARSKGSESFDQKPEAKTHDLRGS